jgi:hypothetical protein
MSFMCFFAFDISALSKHILYALFRFVFVVATLSLNPESF